MKKKKVKFYVVWKGRNTGIFDSWDECNSQIFGFEGAQYKLSSTKEEALFAFQRPYSQSITSKSSVVLPVSAYNNLIVKNSISVDVHAVETRV
jgi:ribonuclease HI